MTYEETQQKIRTARNDYALLAYHLPYSKETLDKAAIDKATGDKAEAEPYSLTETFVSETKQLVYANGSTKIVEYSVRTRRETR